MDVPYDNLKLQQEYNTQDWPINVSENDDDNDDGENFLVRSSPSYRYHPSIDILF